MPPRNKRTIEVEQEFAKSIASHRKRLGLTYEQLADRMKAIGCDIQASGIQKTEKSGRRVTVEELVGYSKVFGIPVSGLLDLSEQLPTKVVWRDLIAAEGLRTVLETVNSEYHRAADHVRKEAESNPELRDHIQERYDRWAAEVKPQAEELARRDGVDISNPEKLAQFLHDWDFENPIMKTARDVLGKAFRHGQ